MRKICVKKCMISFLLVFALFITLYLGINVPFAKAETEEAAQSSSNLYDLYTDDDALINYSNYTIQQYSEALHAKRIKPVFNESNVLTLQNGSEDDPIVGVVPKNLFSSVGQILHIGKEYGFFINTTPLGENYVSDVLVFDIETNTNFVSTIDRVILSVHPIFQYKYAYLKDAQTSVDLSGMMMNYSLSEDRVMPYPSSISSNALQFDMTQRYYLKDISYGLSLYNEQNLNKNDVGYDPYKDNGAFFTAVDYTYNGRSREFGAFPTEEAVNIGLDVVEFAVSFIPGVGPLISEGLGQIRSALDQTNNAINFVNGLADNILGHEIVVGTGELKTQCMYTTRAGQLAYYKDEKNVPTLTKTAALAINTPDEKSVWYGIDDDVTGYFTVSHSSGNVSPDYTRLVKEIGLKVVSATNDQVEKMELSSYDHFFGERVVKQVDDDTVNCYTIKDGYDSFHFLPEYSDYYTIKNFGLYTINVRISGLGTFQIKRQQSIRLSLDRTKTYLFEAGGIESKADFHSFLIQITFDPAPVNTGVFAVDKNATKSYKYVADSNGIISFSTIANQSKLRILDKNLQVVSQTPAMNNPVLELLAEKDEIYFVQIVNQSAGIQNFQLKYSPKTENSPTSQTLQNNTVYFQLNIEVFGNYKFDFVSTYGLAVKIFDENINQIFDTQAKSFHFTFQNPGIYYLAADNASTLPQSISFQKAFCTDPVYFGSNLINYSLGNSIFAFVPTTTAQYNIYCGAADIVWISTDIQGNTVLGNNATLLGGEKYYIRILSYVSRPTMYIEVKDIVTLTDSVAKSSTFNAQEHSFYKIPVTMSGKHKVELTNAQFSLFDQNLEAVQILDGNEFEGLAGRNYYLKVLGAKGNNYNVKFYFNPPALKINEAKVIVKNSYFKYTVSETKDYRLKTFGVNSLTTKISYIYQGNSSASTNGTGHDNRVVVWTPGVYYIYVEVSGSGFVGVSIEFLNQTDYTQNTNFQLKESEMYNIDFLRLETKNYYVNVSEADSYKAFEIRMLKNVYTNYQISVDGKLIPGRDLENGTVSSFSFILPQGQHSVSLRFDTESSTINSDSVNMIYLRQVEDIGLYLTETQTGRIVRDGLRGGHSYHLQLDVNGQIVSDHFIVQDIRSTALNNSLIRYEDGILTVSIDVEFRKDVTIRINYAYVDYYVVTETLYPYRLSSQISIAADKETTFVVNVNDYYTDEAITDFGSAKLTKIDLTGTINGGQVYFMERTDFSFDLTTLNHYADINFSAKVYFSQASWEYMPLQVWSYSDYLNLSSATDSNFTGKKRVEFDTNSPNLSITKTLTIPSNIVAVNLNGANIDSSSYVRYLNIAVQSRTNPLYLNFRNFSFKAGSNQIGVQCSYNAILTIDCAGYVSISGSDSLDWAYSDHESRYDYATEAIYANSVVLRGPGTLNVKGGNGGNSFGWYYFMGFYPTYTQKPGFNAAKGMNCGSLEVSVARLTVRGGDGGHGGVDTEPGAMGMPSTETQGTGKTGGAGDYGGNGGYGADAVYVNSIIITSRCQRADFYGGKGGDGARGQKGGKGGTGGPGKDGKLFVYGTAGGPGGKGGRGGQGGSWGGGGNGLSFTTKTIASSCITNFVGGNAGTSFGGECGDGGDGGPGGWRMDHTAQWPTGATGPKGDPGSPSSYGGNKGAGTYQR